MLLSGLWHLKGSEATYRERSVRQVAMLGGGRFSTFPHEVEEVEEALLGGVEVGDDAACPWSATVSLVEQYGLSDTGEGGEEAIARRLPACTSFSMSMNAMVGSAAVPSEWTSRTRSSAWWSARQPSWGQNEPSSPAFAVMLTRSGASKVVGAATVVDVVL